MEKQDARVANGPAQQEHPIENLKSEIRNRPWQWALAVPLAVGATLCGAALLWGIVYLASTAARLPDPGGASGAAGEAKLATVLYSRDGTEIARYYRENRTPVPYGQIGRPLRQALLATEDHRFFQHSGVDWRRLASAAWQTLRGDRQGGSTLTMQLVRNRYEGIAAAPPHERKAKEILMALKLEQRFSKREILEAYLNTVPFGHGAFGIGAAAEVYFATTATALGPAQAALLVGMLKGPTRYSPTLHPERARQRRNLVLRQMHGRGYLLEKRARRLQSAPLLLEMARPSLADSPAPHFAEAVRRRVERWAAQNGHDFYTGGLRVHTTLDLSMQEKARAATRTQAQKLQAVAAYEWSQKAPRLLSENIEPYTRRAAQGAFEPFARLWEERPDVARRHVRRTARYRRALRHGADTSRTLQRLRTDAAFMDSLRKEVARLDAGLVALAPQTGAVRAWVGGRHFADDQYDKVGLARRQPGSTFKPFVWATALDHGFAPYDAMRGGQLPDPFAPRRTASEGGLSLRNGLAYSSNQMAMALTRAVGPHEVARTARRLGVQSRLREVPSLALGTSEVRLLELTAAYAALAGGGVRHAPRLVERIESTAGRLLERFAPERQRALSRHTSYTTLDMMRDVIDRGTGAPLRQGWQMNGADLAGKTGTTQNNADGWFLAMHPRLVVGAWTGFNDRQIAFRTEHWGHGASNALRLVGAFLEDVLAARPAWSDLRFEPPPGYRAPQPPRAVDSLYAGYETVADGYGADPTQTDHRLRDAVGQGLDTARAGRSGDARYDRLTRRDADPESAFRAQLPRRTDSVQPAPDGTAASDSDSLRQPAPVRTGDLEPRPGTRRDTSSRHGDGR